MPDVELPHFAFPFTFGPGGAAKVVEEDDSAEIAACVANIVICPVGYLPDLPEFGAPDPTFSTVPLDTAAVADAISRYEPRADPEITSAAIGTVQAFQLITIDL